jgi:thioester reductase-like protein
MQRASGRVLCLVRADSPKHALSRLEASLKAHAVWRDEWLERLVAVPGDLARPKLGLDDTSFLELARSVDTILHNGAFLHWLHPYKTLAPANVLGTQEVAMRIYKANSCTIRKLTIASTQVLRLACSSGRAEPTPVHVMSTTSVYEATEVHKLPRVGELELEHWRGIGGGYPQSKWVSDKMAQIARYIVIMHARIGVMLQLS